MPRFRARSSFLGFDKYFSTVEEIVVFVNTNYAQELIKPDDINNHFVDKNVPFFGLKGIIITKEVSTQEVNVSRDINGETLEQA